MYISPPEHDPLQQSRKQPTKPAPKSELSKQDIFSLSPTPSPFTLSSSPGPSFHSSFAAYLLLSCFPLSFLPFFPPSYLHPRPFIASDTDTRCLPLCLEMALEGRGVVCKTVCGWCVEGEARHENFNCSCVQIIKCPGWLQQKT